MTDLCTESDVLSRPALQGVTLSAVQLAQTPGYIGEASTLVCGYLAHMYAADETVPNAVVIVTARVVARALTTSPTDPNVDSYASTRAMGSFSASNTAHVAQDVLGGGVWLTRQDKMALDAIDGIGSQTAINVPLYRLSWCPDAPDGWWLMAPAPGGSP